jgi:hypothetical protein
VAFGVASWQNPVSAGRAASVAAQGVTRLAGQGSSFTKLVAPKSRSLRQGWYRLQTYEIAKTEFKVADFLEWQRQGSLDLQPVFQRRNVWKPGAKSFLVDTVVRGLPTPIIFLRDRVDLGTLRPTREVVDGQQRLRTLISYIDPSALTDYDPAYDDFVVRRTHNAELAGARFDQLAGEFKHRLLNYTFSTHVMPSSVEDREILMIFQRLNSTGERLTPQELRNARFFGEFKTLMYELALEELERWRMWGIFSGDEISRMKEVELTSDISVAMLEGFAGKSQARINRAYDAFDDDFPQAANLTSRFRRTMDAIDDLLDDIKESVFSREIWFVVLYFFIYRRLYENSDVSVRRSPRKLPKALSGRLLAASDRIQHDTDLPKEVLDAIRGASSDPKSRRTRLAFLEDVAS